MVDTTSHVVLVNEKDDATGTMEKMEAHQKGMLHRAFSVFLFNAEGEMLLQRRSMKKYHSGGLWTNACCSHPFPGEDNLVAAKRRTYEELGIEIELYEAFSFVYKAALDNGLTEHEFDHVFIGTCKSGLNPDPNEVADHAYLSIAYIKNHIQCYPEKYTVWFKIAFPLLEEFMSKHAQ